MNKGVLLKKHFIYVTLLLIIWMVYVLCGIPCPIKAVFGVPCPTCGVTHAMIALLKRDFMGYVAYNPMAVFLVVDVWVAIHMRYFKRARTIMWIYLSVTLILNLVIYFIKVLTS